MTNNSIEELRSEFFYTTGTEEKNLCWLCFLLFGIEWRKGRDSNPRYGYPHA